MYSLKWSFLFVFTFAGSSYAKTDKELKEDFTKLVMMCLKDNPVDLLDLAPLQQLVVPTKKEVKCLLACAYKKMSTMNSKGMYDIEKAYEVAELVKNGTPDDEKRLKNARKLVDICSKVNDESVSDGEKGCDRAVLIFKCGVENAPKLGFNLL